MSEVWDVSVTSGEQLSTVTNELQLDSPTSSQGLNGRSTECNLAIEDLSCIVPTEPGYLGSVGTD